MTFKLVSIALLVSASSLFPQNWRLILTNGDTLSGVSLEKLAGDSILVSQDASINSIPIASLVSSFHPSIPAKKRNHSTHFGKAKLAFPPKL